MPLTPFMLLTPIHPSAQVTKDITVRPTPAVTGDVPPPVHSNLSWLDAKGAFLSCQERDAKSADNSTIDLQEFGVCLALCGQIKYEEVEQMSLAQRVEGILANYFGEKDEQQVITEAAVPKVERLSVESVQPMLGQDPDEHNKFVSTWGKMDLGHVYGFPLWEKEVFQLLQRSFGELVSVFSYYSKSGTAGSGSAAAAETMQQTELINLALDVGLATDTFPMARVQGVFERADQTDNKRGGDNGLAYHEFLEAVVMLAFHRANPKFGQVGFERAAAAPLPDCLEQLLTKQLLKRAKQDDLISVRQAVTAEPDVQVILFSSPWPSPFHPSAVGGQCTLISSVRPSFVRSLRRRTLPLPPPQVVIWSNKAALLKAFRATLSKAPTSPTKAASPTRGKDAMSLDALLGDLASRELIGDALVQPVAAIKGEMMAPVHLNLSTVDAKGAFVTALSPTGKFGPDVLDFDGFIVCLALCGHVKYEEVKQMSLAQRVKGLMDNYLGTRSAQDVLTEAMVTQVKRFQISDASPLPGQPIEAHSLLVECWKAMDVSNAFGFPLWEKAVFQLLQANFTEVAAVFAHYSRSGAQGSLLNETLQENELASLVRDTGLTTDTFSLARIQTIYAQLGSRSARDAMTLPAFLELLIFISLYRANPHLGEAGGPATPATPLPGCLETLLTSHLLKRAKRDKLLSVKGELSERSVKDVLSKQRGDLKKRFEATCKAKGGARTLFGQSVMSVTRRAPHGNRTAVGHAIGDRHHPQDPLGRAFCLSAG